MKVDRIWVGKKVRMAFVHGLDSRYYPAKGTIGTVIEDCGEGNEGDLFVQWPKGTTKAPCKWYVNKKHVKVIEDNKPTLMPYDEIWEMLRPKMEKNGFHSYICRLFNYELERYERTEFYNPKDFQKAVALAYKMGYERAMKGRPFKYGEKKVKKVEGHWEKVDPSNPPKDGTRVRYAREYEIYNNDLVVGDEGILRGDVFVPDTSLHRKFHNYYFICHLNSFDYWVEGDDAD